MTRAKVSELKARLSAYLAEVRGGGEVLVYDRTTPIAKLVPVKEERDDIQLIPESSPPSTLKRIKGVRPRRPVNLDKLLGELRQDR
jgi:prevent-host-death family protein